MLNAIRSLRYIDQRFAFKNSRISWLALIFKLKNQSTEVLYAKKLVAAFNLHVAKYDETMPKTYTIFFRTIDTNLFMIA